MNNERQARLHCNYCDRDLSSSVCARCAVYPDYDFFFDCFSLVSALLLQNLVNRIHKYFSRCWWKQTGTIAPANFASGVTSSFGEIGEPGTGMGTRGVTKSANMTELYIIRLLLDSDSQLVMEILSQVVLSLKIPIKVELHGFWTMVWRQTLTGQNLKEPDIICLESLSMHCEYSQTYQYSMYQFTLWCACTLLHTRNEKGLLKCLDFRQRKSQYSIKIAVRDMWKAEKKSIKEVRMIAKKQQSEGEIIKMVI